MAENKRIDDKDLMFINQKWTEEEKKSFSEFLKTRKKRKPLQNIVKDSSSNENFTPSGLGY